MHAYVLETPRLTLRALKCDDAEAAFVWCSDPEVNRYMPYSLYTQVEDVRQWLTSIEAATEEYHFGFVRKSDGLLIGSGSIGPNDDEAFWEFGYNFRRDCWGNGYATEAAQAMIDFAFREFGVRSFAANHAMANPASGRVMQKCGMVIDRTGAYSRFDGSETFPALFYRLQLNMEGKAPRYTFVPMTAEHFDAYFAWTYPTPYEFYNNPPETYAECLAEYLAAPENWYAALDESGQMTGMFELSFSGNIAEVGLGLCPGHTGIGNGEQFVRAILAFAQSNYVLEEITLRVADFNLRARKVYERIGFRAAGSENADCFGTPVTFIRMVLDHDAC